VHKQCGGIVAGVDNEEFECQKCGKKERAIGAVLPAGTQNRNEYFATHPELEVLLMNEQEAAAAQNGTWPRKSRSLPQLLWWKKPKQRA
jgi:hypothetical protein